MKPTVGQWRPPVAKLLGEVPIHVGARGLVAGTTACLNPFCACMYGSGTCGWPCIAAAAELENPDDVDPNICLCHEEACDCEDVKPLRQLRPLGWAIRKGPPGFADYVQQVVIIDTPGDSPEEEHERFHAYVQHWWH